jgi:integrase
MRFGRDYLYRFANCVASRTDNCTPAAQGSAKPSRLATPLSRSRLPKATHVINGSFRRICDPAGIAYGTGARRGLRFHDLRHSAATLLLAQGVPQRVVMEILGHSTLRMTARYTHVVPELLTQAATAMDRALGS